MRLPQFRYLGAFAPTCAAVPRDENARRLGPGQLKIRKLGAEGQPADVGEGQPGARLAPGLAQVIGAPHTLARSGEYDAFPSNDAGHLLSGQPARSLSPVV